MAKAIVEEDFLQNVMKLILHYVCVSLQVKSLLTVCFRQVAVILPFKFEYNCSFLTLLLKNTHMCIGGKNTENTVNVTGETLVLRKIFPSFMLGQTLFSQLFQLNAG